MFSDSNNVTSTMQPRWASRRRAFTLLEVLFSLGLSLLLMGAMLSAVEVYRQLSVAGRSDVAQAQLLRAILRTMELDIRSCTFNNPTISSSDEGEEESAEGEESTEEIVVTEIDSADAFAGQSIGIVGDSTTLVIHINRPPRKLDSIRLADAGVTETLAGDLRSVSYFLATPGGNGLQGAAGDILDTTGSREVQGLARLEGDRLSLQFADATGDLSALVENTSLLAAEVDYLQFRYFDGLQWLDIWDSTAYERLPTAVEITIGIGSSPSADDAATTTNGDVKESKLYRFVVVLPSAQPAVLTTGTEPF